MFRKIQERNGTHVTNTEYLDCLHSVRGIPMANKRCMTFVDGYAKYASYLVNNDSSSLTVEEQENADDFVDAIREDYPHAHIWELLMDTLMITLMSYHPTLVSLPMHQWAVVI